MSAGTKRATNRVRLAIKTRDALTVRDTLTLRGARAPL
jgi:hypothetical protein